MSNLSSELFYVGIKNKIELRRSILEASKESIHMLKEYETLKEHSARRMAKMEELRSIMKEICSLETKLGSLLPNIPVHASASQTKLSVKSKDVPLTKYTQGAQPVEEKAVQPAPKQQVQVKKKLTELEKLEEDLARVEGKLSSLGI